MTVIEQLPCRHIEINKKSDLDTVGLQRPAADTGSAHVVVWAPILI